MADSSTEAVAVDTQPLRILVAHNFYQQRGGEDAVVEDEIRLLTQHGHEVRTFVRHNDDVRGRRLAGLAVQTVWSVETTRALDALIANWRPDVIHVHNTLPLISPSLYWCAHKHKIPVVQTLHNFRLLCPQAMLLRNNQICEDCLGKLPWRGVARACYRQSATQTAVLAISQITHRMLGTWQRKVNRYIALNQFCRNKFIEGGLPADKIAVKPNFVDFPLPVDRRRSGFLFVGRLSVEKGVHVLAQAVSLLPVCELRVAGVGAEQAELDGKLGIVQLGMLGADAVRDAMESSTALVLPSIWYENFPRTLVEAMGAGLPVIASRIGALAELVEEGVTGLLFEPGNATDLAQKMQWAQDHPERMAQMGRAARLQYEARYTATRNYEQLMTIYHEVVAENLGETNG